VVGFDNAEQVIARYPRRSQATRANLVHKADVQYGGAADEVLDLFLAAHTPAPIQIFVHGGAWRNFTKADYSFPADAYVPAGIHTVVLNFSKLPQVRLPEAVEQVRRGFEWVYRHAAAFGGDQTRIFTSGHSSGAHLAAMALIENWPARGLPENFIRAATLLSGPFDLEPMMLSARSSYVSLSPEEVAAFSPMRHVDRIKCPVIIAYAQGDTDEFQRQSRAFAGSLDRVGHLAGLLELPGVNHFEAMEEFGQPRSTLVAAILAQMAIDPSV
jgi:arylformamidase